MSLITALGFFTVHYTDNGICRLVLPCVDQNTGNGIYVHKCDHKAPAYILELGNRLNIYIKGVPVIYDFPLDLQGYSIFCRKVWDSVKRIPYGQVRSYKWVANDIGIPSGVRAVGQALAKNPVPILIPCHRVISSNGNLGGFAGKIALTQFKQKLLSIEGFSL